MRSIKAKFIITVLSITMISLGVLSTLNYWNARQALVKDIEESLTALAVSNSEKFGLWLDARKGEVLDLAEDQVMQTDMDSIIVYLKNESKRNNKYLQFDVSDLDGNTYNTVNNKKINIANCVYFQQAKAGQVVVSDPFISEIDGETKIIIAAPIINTGRIVGVLGGTLTMDGLNKLLRDIKVGKTGIAYIKQSDGLTILNLDPTLAMKDNQLKNPNADPTITAMTEMMVKGQKGVAKIRFNGVTKYAAYTPVPGTTWSLGISLPEKEANAKLNPLLWSSLLTAMLALVIAISATSLLAKRFTEPIHELHVFAQRVAGGDFSATRVGIHSQDEIGRLAEAFNSMVANIQEMVRTIQNNNTELTDMNEELTAINEELNVINEELVDTNQELHEEISKRQQVEQELVQAINDLKRMQDYLIQSEKMVALGSLVAGVAHEINTPVGVSITAASYLEQTSKEFGELCKNGTPRRQDLINYLDNLEKSAAIILRNLERAGNLIKSFKQVSVDQSSEVQRIFNIGKYLKEILLSINPKIKKTKHKISVDCPEDLNLDAFPGAFAQIITNLVMNSLIHAYGPEEEGNIRITAYKEQDHITIIYGDDGKGIESNVLPRIFEPFFTTNRGAGGSGLGLYIVYNIVTQQFGGTIECDSLPGKGLIFRICLPLERGIHNCEIR